MARNIPRDAIIHLAINKKVVAPCKDCTDRCVNCHSKCSKYAEYKESLYNAHSEYIKSIKAERLGSLSEIEVRQRTIRTQGRGTSKKWSAYKGVNV